MQIGMENAVVEGLGEKGAYEIARQSRAVEALLLEYARRR